MAKSNKSKIIKLIVILAIVAVVIVATIIILSFVKKNNQNKKEVLTIPVSSICSDASMWGEGDSSYEGRVVSSMSQKVYITNTTKIDEIMVYEGQQVKAGDLILKYDLTAQQLQLDSKKASVALAQNYVTSLERDLKRLKEITPIEDMPKPPTTQAPTTEEPVTEATTTEAPVTEEPTTEVPVTEEPTTEATTTEEPTTEASATEEPTTEAPTTEAPTTEAPATEAPTTEEPTTEAPIDDFENNGEMMYTRDELDKAIKAKEAEIRDAKVSAALEEIAYEIMLNQNSSPELYSNYDGVVTSLLDEETALSENKPLIVISNSEGLTIEAYVGEYSLADTSIGDEMELYCYDTGMTYTGTVSDVGMIPNTSYSSWGANESYYPVEISVLDADDLTQGMYLQVNKPVVYDEASSSDYIMTIPVAFIRKEGGKRYVMKEVDGKLKKTYVKVGKTYWGSEIEILSGLSQEDYIAFPYTADAVEGVKSRRGTIEELYGY